MNMGASGHTLFIQAQPWFHHIINCITVQLHLPITSFGASKANRGKANGPFFTFNWAFSLTDLPWLLNVSNLIQGYIKVNVSRYELPQQRVTDCIYL